MIGQNTEIKLFPKFLFDSGIRPLFVIPHERERENVEDVAGYDASTVFITTPGQVC